MPPTTARPYHSARDLRASDAEREATVDRLRIAATEGRIDAEELEERLTSAYAARWRSELDALTADVTPPPARPEPWRPSFVTPARRRTTNVLAVLSFVAAVLFWFGPAGAIAALVLGHVALRRIASSNGMQRGRGWAYTGLTLAYIKLLAIALLGLSGLIPGPF
jgi:Domain of unknown function (DUF1707)/Domain of unknown function (DUF4190)